MGGGTPEDNSDEVARIEAQAAREAREEERRREAQALQEFQQRLGSAYDTGIQGALDYFTSQGLDPNQYAGAIRSRGNLVRGGIPQGDTNPGSYFQNLGEMVYNAEQEAARNRHMRAIDSIAPTGFSTSRITNDVDDEIIASILGEQQNTARSYVDNLRDRGVITGSGYNAAVQNLERQLPTARSRLDEVALGILEGGRAGAENLVNRNRSTVSNLRLGTNFDPFNVGTELNNYFADFFAGLGDRYRATAPSNLFDTSGLAGVAGAAQGAQNTPFDPNALAGIFDDDEEEENADTTAPTSPF